MTLVISKVNGSIKLANAFTWNETVWNPSMIQTALWLDAADATTLFNSDTGGSTPSNSGAIGRWVDKSGNGYNALQATAGNRPTYNSSALNGKGGVSFDRVNVQRLLTGSIPNNDIVGKSISVVQVIKPVTGWTGGGGGNSSFMSSLGTRPGGGTWWSFIRNPTNNEIGFHGQAQYWSGSNLSANASIIIDTVTNGTNLNEWRDGSQIQTNLSIGTFTNNQNAPMYIGDGSGFTSAEAFNGLILEVIFFTSSISTSVRQKLEGYLAHKWGLTANLPSDHPYKTVGPTP